MVHNTLEEEDSRGTSQIKSRIFALTVIASKPLDINGTEDGLLTREGVAPKYPDLS